EEVRAPSLGELAGENPSERVDRPAGRKRDYETHGFVGVGLRGRVLRQSQGARQDGKDGSHFGKCAGKACEHAFLPTAVGRNLSHPKNKGSGLQFADPVAATLVLASSSFDASDTAWALVLASLIRAWRSEAASLRHARGDWMGPGSAPGIERRRSHLARGAPTPRHRRDTRAPSAAATSPACP